MNSEKDFWKIAAIVAVCYFGYLFYQKQKDAPKPEPEKPTTESVSKVLDKIYKQDRADRLAVLKELSAKQFATDQEKLKWINEESAKRRIETNIPYTDRVAEAIFENKIQDLIKELERGR